MGQRTLVSSGVWVSPLEKRFRPTPLEAVRLRPGDVALVPLEAGRRLHAFELTFQDVRPLSQLFFRVVRDHWLSGTHAGQLISVEELFRLARAACERLHAVPVPSDRDLLAWATRVQGIEVIDGDAQIINAMYLDVNLLNASEDVLFDWRPRIDPQILHRSPEEDHACRSLAIIGVGVGAGVGVEVGAGWHMRFRPLFPAEGPAAELIPVWNFVGYYLPDISDAVSSGA